VNNRTDDITTEPVARRVCKTCGRLAHSPEPCLPRQVSDEALRRLIRV
jgi:hypothetical protein